LNRPRELTEQFLRGALEGMKLLDQYEAACKFRRLASRTIQTYRRWVEEFLRFHHDRTGRWIDPNEMGEPEVEAFLTDLAVNRRVAESTQNQALGAILFLYRHVLAKDLGSLDAVRANRPSGCQPCSPRKRYGDSSPPCRRKARIG
jgi:site-specific recombinase XerD